MRFTDFAAASEVFKNYTGNYDAKVGIIGAGTIGKLVIQKLKDYVLDVLVFDPFLSDESWREKGKPGYDFAECNVISNHLADNQQTRGMLNGVLFEKMLPYATFLNTGRGQQVVKPDLIQVLKMRPEIIVSSHRT